MPSSRRTLQQFQRRWTMVEEGVFMCLLVGISFILVINQRLPDTPRSKWKLAQAYARGIEDGVGDRRSGCHSRRLSRTYCWLVRTVDQDDLYFGHFGKG